MNYDLKNKFICNPNVYFTGLFPFPPTHHSPRGKHMSSATLHKATNQMTQFSQGLVRNFPIKPNRNAYVKMKQTQESFVDLQNAPNCGPRGPACAYGLCHV